MDIGLFIPPADYSASSASATGLSENGQLQQHTQGKTFSTLFKGLAENVPDEEGSSPSKSDDPAEPAPPSDAGKQAAMALVMGIASASISVVRDPPEVSVAGAGSAESTPNAQPSLPQGMEVLPFTLENVSMVHIHEAGAMGQDSAAAEGALPATTDLPGLPPLRALVVPGESGEAPAMTPKQTASRMTDKSFIRNGRGAPVDLPPASLDEPFSTSLLPSTLPQDSLISDQGTIPVLEHQGARNLLAAAYVNGMVRPLERPSTGIQPSEVVLEQGPEGATLLGQPLAVSVIGEIEEGGQDPFGADAQGTGGETSFHSGESGALESLTRDNQPSFFSGQLMSSRQAQSSIGGESSSGVTSAADPLKTAQALLGEDHSASITSASGKAQIVHVELPSHDSGPLSVRISMTDQMVHTQFTTDRNDLGALLFTRQDQLQHSLAKSGLELGQFQVHIDQQGRQEMLQDRQSRQNGEASEQQLTSQDHNQQAQDRERSTHRPPRALSVFA